MKCFLLLSKLLLDYRRFDNFNTTNKYANYDHLGECSPEQIV